MFIIYDKYREEWNGEVYGDRESCEKQIDSLIQISKNENRPYDYDILDLSEIIGWKTYYFFTHKHCTQSNGATKRPYTNYSNSPIHLYHLATNYPRIALYVVTECYRSVLLFIGISYHVFAKVGYKNV